MIYTNLKGDEAITAFDMDIESAVMEVDIGYRIIQKKIIYFVCVVATDCNWNILLEIQSKYF